MRYSISKVEKILGISQSTLRRYEEAGLLEVRRMPESKYRYFSTGDIARLSVFLGMRQQDFLPQEIGEIAGRKDKLTYVYKRLEEIEKEIETLQAEKTCWRKHLQLSGLMEELRQKPDGGKLCRCEALIGSCFSDEQTAYDALYFQMYRQKEIGRNYFRLCCLFAQQEQENIAAYRQAYCIPLSLLKRDDILRIKNKVYLPEQDYIAAFAPGMSIIDEEQPQEAKRIVEQIRQKTNKLLEQFGVEQNGDAMTMTVTVTRSGHESILFIPVKKTM